MAGQRDYAGRSTVYRMAIAIGLLAYCTMAVGNGLDRASLVHPGLARHLPSLFASQAFQVRGRIALLQGKAKVAAALGEQAVRAAPVDPGSTALLGAARLADGQQGKAETAFRIAGALGWRVAYTQAYWMTRALEIPDYRVAALRLDALLRQQPDLVRQRQLLDPMERNPAGRSAMIDRMLLHPDWVPAYAQLIDETPLDSMQQRATVLSELAQRGSVLGCAAIAPATSRLASLGAVQDGARLWRDHCSLAHGGLITDGNLTAVSLDFPRSPFLWQLIGDGDVTSGLVPSPLGSGQRLTIASSAGRPRQILSQLLAVSPGRYSISWLAGGESGTPKDGILAATTCAQVPDGWTIPTFDPATQLWRARLDIDGRCAGHRLILAVAPNIGSIWIEQIRLTPIP